MPSFHRLLIAIVSLSALAVPAAAQMTCRDLMNLRLPDTKITSATMVERGSALEVPRVAAAQLAGLPTFCRVSGTVEPEVNFEVWMPAEWNGKFLAVGNGGLAGTINYGAMLDPLRRGYATASTDTGHVADSDGRWAEGHMQRVVDFAHRGIHVMTVASKAIISAHHGVVPEHSYFAGCSQGGQEALTEAQRYPQDYDGIIAGDPANYWTRLYVGGHLWIAQATMLDPASYIPAAKVQILGDAVNAACDGLDGVVDGVLNDPRRCHFNPDTLLCSGGGEGDNCFSAAQIAAIKKIYQGARTPDGEQIFPGIMPGGEAGGSGWAAWITGSQPGRGSHMTLGFPFMRYIVFEDPAWELTDFRFDRPKLYGAEFDSDVDRTDAKLGGLFNNMNPDLRAFQARGGKLIQYHGWSDPDISPLNSIHYYDSVVNFMAATGGQGRVQTGLTRTQEFYRLFMAPGMQHCGGGPGPDNFDMVSALDRWVAEGVAPDRVVATHATAGQVDRSRPLCAYPKEAQWTGQGSTDDAANFVCAMPAVP